MGLCVGWCWCCIYVAFSWTYLTCTHTSHTHTPWVCVLVGPGDEGTKIGSSIPNQEWFGTNVVHRLCMCVLVFVCLCGFVSAHLRGPVPLFGGTLDLGFESACVCGPVPLFLAWDSKMCVCVCVRKCVCLLVICSSDFTIFSISPQYRYILASS